MMKKDAVLVNAARGPVIDEKALVAFLQANENFRCLSWHGACLGAGPVLARGLSWHWGCLGTGPVIAGPSWHEAHLSGAYLGMRPVSAGPVLTRSVLTTSRSAFAGV